MHDNLATACLALSRPPSNYLPTHKEFRHHGGESSGGGSANRGGNKLARRARSFKEDFLDILSQMRSPGSGGGTSGSASSAGSPKPPRSPKPRTSSSSDVPQNEERNPLADLDLHVKQVQLALKHFRDVVSKNKLEVLPGNGTIVLESIATIQSVLKTFVFFDQSTALMSATKQVYQSLTMLIKLCDDVLIGGEKGLNKQNVTEVLQQVEDAVQNLVSLVRGKLSDHKSLSKINHASENLPYKGIIVEPPLRSSLPDIPLTPRERQALLEGAARHHHQTYSSESITDTPPPKPPLPVTKVWIGDSPPPLPPKKKSSGGGTVVGPPSHSMERLSLRSDNSSLGSLDSMLNTSSKDEEELHAIMDEENSITLPDASLLAHDFTGMGSLVNGSQASSCCWDSSCSNASDHTHLTESPDPPASSFNSHSIVGCMSSAVERSTLSSAFVSLHQSSTQSFNYSSSSHSSSATTVSCAASTGTTLEESRIISTTTTTRQQISSSAATVSSGDVVDRSTPPPPALPEKKRSRRERHPSQYDNVPSVPVCQPTSNSSPTDSKPPPLPLKKKHIMAYMEMFGNCSQPSASELLRHSVHTYSLLEAEWQQHQVSLTTTQSCSFTHSFSTSQSNHDTLEDLSGGKLSPGLPPALPPKRGRLKSAATPPPIEPAPPVVPTTPPPLPSTPPPSAPRKEYVEPVVPAAVTATSTVEVAPVTNGGLIAPVDASPLFELDVSKLLVFMRPDEEGPAIRGGHPDALVIHATKASKNVEKEPDFLYQEAFLTTYRTFMQPLDLIEKLCMRQQRFSGNIDPAKQRSARETFSLLVRVVSDLTVSDLEDTVMKALMEFVYQLLCAGDLTMARVLRVIILEKYNNKQMCSIANTSLSSQQIYTRQSTLIDFKSDHVAEQMTLLDSELFMKIEIPEVLIWAQEQNEERSPNLTRFTEHFNKMSYWARSRILEQNDAKDRERYVVKFIKIMKHLRKINNFNSYLALLSALDSAPIRRLEWQKHITEGLKEYCALIDSSSSFRAYRQALGETQPPCIPYIGLVLQDLTFVHIGNSDYLSDGVINFSKRWQQFNIVENMKRFKKGTYNFKKNERIIAFFSNFDDFLCEEAMWQISESIKPRGSKKTTQ
ncbi:C3G guanyl-nucleotide exchange factor isoform X3 [Rhodnius prolixus]|uniref:C3G guanyl-nucleotide exchange factor isoform X3 n=1 Tax=Rhodnius prolixus TaxID=13249 RepID=UPI003D18AE44